MMVAMRTAHWRAGCVMILALAAVTVPAHGQTGTWETGWGPITFEKEEEGYSGRLNWYGQINEVRIQPGRREARFTFLGPGLKGEGTGHFQRSTFSARIALDSHGGSSHVWKGRRVLDSSLKGRVKRITAQLDGGNRDERLEAAYMAEQLGPLIGAPGRDALLRRVRKDKDSWVVAASLRALMRHGSDAGHAVPSILAALRRDAHPDIAAYVDALSRLGPRARKAVPGALRHRNVNVQLVAALLAAREKRPRKLWWPTLVRCSEDEHARWELVDWITENSWFLSDHRNELLTLHEEGMSKIQPVSWMRIFAKMNPPERSRPEVIEACLGDTTVVRSDFAENLRLLQPDRRIASKVLSALLRWLDVEGADFREQVVDGFGALAVLRDEVRPRIEAFLAATQPANLRAAALRSLGRIDVGHEIDPRIIEAFEGGEPLIRDAAWQAIVSQLRASTSARDYVLNLAKTDHEYASNAIQALGQHRSKDAGFLEIAFRNLVDPGRDATNLRWRVRHLGKPFGADAAAYEEMLGGEDRLAKLWALFSLVDRAHRSEAIQALVSDLTQSSDALLAAHALRALTAVRKDGASRVLAEALSREEAIVRAAAADALTHVVIRAEEIPALVSRLGEEALRPALVLALRQQEKRTPELFEKLRPFLADENPRVRVQVIRFFGDAEQVAASEVPAIGRLTSDEEPEVRMAAVLALGGIGVCDDQVVAHLSARLKDRDPDVRVATLKGVGMLGKAGRKLARFVRPLRYDDDSRVASTARATLKSLR